VVSAEKAEARLVESDPVRTTGLGGNEHGSVRAFDDSTLNREGAKNKVDVDPAQCKQLTTSGTGHGSECEIELQRRVGFCDRLEQPGDFEGSRWSHLSLHTLRWLARSATFSKTHDHRSAWARAACKVECTRRTEPTASGFPPRRPFTRSFS
jgi:hypothetical protein